jgi:glycerophosphoryl diester phosphodiesterase
MQAEGIDALNLHHSQWSTELIEALALQGRLAFAWDLQESAELRRALELGVHGVYSDHVDRMQEALRQHGDRIAAGR